MKWHVTFAVDFQKANDPSILAEPHVHRTEVLKSYNDSIGKMFSAAYNTLLQNISNYQSNGSELVVDHFIDL